MNSKTPASHRLLSSTTPEFLRVRPSQRRTSRGPAAFCAAAAPASARRSGNRRDQGLGDSSAPKPHDVVGRQVPGEIRVGEILADELLGEVGLPEPGDVLDERGVRGEGGLRGRWILRPGPRSGLRSTWRRRRERRRERAFSFVVFLPDPLPAYARRMPWRKSPLSHSLPNGYRQEVPEAPVVSGNCNRNALGSNDFLGCALACGVLFSSDVIERLNSLLRVELAAVAGYQKALRALKKKAVDRRRPHPAARLRAPANGHGAPGVGSGPGRRARRGGGPLGGLGRRRRSPATARLLQLERQGVRRRAPRGRAARSRRVRGFPGLARRGRPRARRARADPAAAETRRGALRHARPPRRVTGRRLARGASPRRLCYFARSSTWTPRRPPDPAGESARILRALRHALADPLSAAALKLDLVERRLMAPSGADPSWVVERIRAVQADVGATNRLLDLLLRLAEIAGERPGETSLRDVCRTAGVALHEAAADRPRLPLRQQVVGRGHPECRVVRNTRRRRPCADRTRRDSRAGG